MEYKTDKRTKNLNLRDIHVGDWVQVWRPLPKEYTPPMKVSSIHYDGTVYLVSDDEGHCNPYEANIKDIDALPIDGDLLTGFGFNVIRQAPSEPCIEPYLVIIDNICIGELRLTTLFGIKTWDLQVKKDPFDMEYIELEYMHELVDYMHRYYIDVKLEWKGIEK